MLNGAKGAKNLDQVFHSSPRPPSWWDYYEKPEDNGKGDGNEINIVSVEIHPEPAEPAKPAVPLDPVEWINPGPIHKPLLLPPAKPDPIWVHEDKGNKPTAWVGDKPTAWVGDKPTAKYYWR